MDGTYGGHFPDQRHPGAMWMHGDFDKLVEKGSDEGKGILATHGWKHLTVAK